MILPARRDEHRLVAFATIVTHVSTNVKEVASDGSASVRRSAKIEMSREPESDINPLGFLV